MRGGGRRDGFHDAWAQQLADFLGHGETWVGMRSVRGRRAARLAVDGLAHFFPGSSVKVRTVSEAMLRLYAVALSDGVNLSSMFRSRMPAARRRGPLCQARDERGWKGRGGGGGGPEKAALVSVWIRSFGDTVE